MDSNDSAKVTSVTGHPVLIILASFPIACFSGALVTDIAYAATANMMWADFSAWLLAAGMVMGVLAAVAGLGVLVSTHRTRTRPVTGLVVGSLLVLILALFNNMVHSRDAWTSVVPVGLLLSAITVAIMIATAWLASATRIPRDIDLPYSGVRQ